MGKTDDVLGKFTLESKKFEKTPFNQEMELPESKKKPEDPAYIKMTVALRGQNDVSFIGSDSDTFLIHKISWGLFWLCPSSWLLIDVGACFQKDILSQVAFSWLSRKRPILA